MKGNVRTGGLSKRLGLVIIALSLWAAPATAQEATETYRVYADGIPCPFCAYGLEKKLRKIEGVETLEVDIEQGAIIVTMAGGAALDEAAARRAVEAAGFSLRGFEHVESMKRAEPAQ